MEQATHITGDVLQHHIRQTKLHYLKKIRSIEKENKMLISKLNPGMDENTANELMLQIDANREYIIHLRDCEYDKIFELRESFANKHI